MLLDQQCQGRSLGLGLLLKRICIVNTKRLLVSSLGRSASCLSSIELRHRWQFEQASVNFREGIVETCSSFDWLVCDHQPKSIVLGCLKLCIFVSFSLVHSVLEIEVAL